MNIGNLEQRNTQIDVWIDEEEYAQIQNQFNEVEDLECCFEPTYCTSGEDADKNWQKVLTSNTIDIPVGFKDGTKIDKDWSKLFYAKLLRSKIQKMGTDCYFRRLDQVIAYLEKNMPDPYDKKGESAKLAVHYLLELSAASLTYESMGYAERARRLLQDSKYLKDEENEYFRWFHELLACDKYNY